MDISTLCPLSVTAFEWTLADGRRAVTVVCKATFPLEPGTDAALAPVQEPISLRDRVEGSGEGATLVAASDLVPYKAAADVILTGSAYAPPGRTAASVSARLVVGAEIDKTLQVTAPGGTSFDRVALPVGFGPVPPSSPSRAQKLGGAPPPGLDWAERPLPWTIDPAFFNVAPGDQRLKAIRPDESILLFGLLRDREKFGMRLPGVRPKAFAQNGGDAKEVPLAADTLWIDTDRALVTVTWRGQLPLGSTADRVVLALQQRDAALTWADVESRLGRDGQSAPAVPSPPPSPPPVLAQAPMPAFIGRRPSDGPAPPRSDPPPEPVAPPAVTAREPLDLVWFDETLAPRLRASRPWRALVDALELVASDDGAAGDAEDRREVFHVLASGDARDVSELPGVLAAAIAPDGKLEPPLVLVSGDVSLPFDAAELLRVTLAACKPVAPTDKAFGDVVATVAAMADAAALSDAVAHGLTWRLREAFQQVKHSLPPRYLESTAERALLDGRRYQRREVFGAPHVRALVAAASGDPVPAYLPVGIAARLPLFLRYRARLIAEVNAQVDHEEAHPCALRVLAIARAVARPAS